jgi:hypothetical protein
VRELTRINPAVVDTKGYEVDLLALNLSSINSSVLLLKVKRKLGTIMSTIRLSKKTKVTVLILRKLSVESLEEIPDSRSSSESRYSVVSAVAETSADGLINI